MWVPYPNPFPADSPTINSIDVRLDLAFVVLDQHSGLPALLRHYHTP